MYSGCKFINKYLKYKINLIKKKIERYEIILWR